MNLIRIRTHDGILTVMSDAQTITIIGQCSGITEKPSGWTEFQISVPGKNYPVKLATKLDGLVQAARDTKGALATWTYKETEGDINPRSGKPYKNRYLESVELGAAAAQAQITRDGQPSNVPEPQAHHDPVHFADKDRIISRLAILKAAASQPRDAAYEDDQDWAWKVMETAERFEEWLYRDIDNSEANARTKPQTMDASPASGNGLTMPQTWHDVEVLLTAYGDNDETWELFSRFGLAARKFMFGDEGLSQDEKDQLWQVTVGAALKLRDMVDAAEFPPPTEEDMTKAWASVLDGQELQPVAKKEVPDAP